MKYRTFYFTKQSVSSKFHQKVLDMFQKHELVKKWVVPEKNVKKSNKMLTKIQNRKKKSKSNTKEH